MKAAEISFHLPLDSTFLYAIPNNLEEKISFGKRVKTKFGRQQLIGYVIDIKDVEQELKREIIEVIDDEPILTPELLKLAQIISDYYGSSLGEALNTIFQLNLIVKNKKVPHSPNEVPKHVESKFKVVPIFHFNFLERLNIYLDETLKTLNLGGDVLLIFPEIKLSSFLFSFFQSKLPFCLGIWHGNLKPYEKYNLWFSVKSGNIKVCLGTRSAIFLPFKNLKLIVVDEDTEKKSYKETHFPKYDLVKVACFRASLNNSKFIIGNTIPSLETFYNIENGEYKEQISRDYQKLRLPNVEIVDLSESWKVISDNLRNEINYRLARNEQVLLIYNKRGFASFVMCIRCGNVYKCQKCDVSLVYYSDEKNLKCHYCGFKQEFIGICKRCGVSKFKFYGYGIQKIEQTILKEFPHIPFCVLPTKDIEKISQKIEDHQIDIILSTVGIHKYKNILNFSKLGLIGFIDFDAIIYFPKYNSTELGFYSLMDIIFSYLLTDKNHDVEPKVIIQTHTPQHYLLQALRTLNFRDFYLRELEFRKKLFYPPFSELILVSFSSKKKEKSFEEANIFSDFLKSANLEGVNISHPFEAHPPKVKLIFKYQILLKVPNEKVIQTVKFIKKYKKKYSTVKMVIDVTPLEL